MRCLVTIIMKWFCALSILSLHSVYGFEMGIGTHISNYNMSAEKTMSDIKKYGFTSIRDELYWNDVEVENNSFSIPAARLKNDELFKNSRQHDLTTLMVLDYGNKIHTKMGFPSNESQIASFVNYAKWVAKRYKGKITYYEIWNEWLYGTGMSKNYKKKIPSPTVYFQLIQQTSKAIKTIDPKAIIIAGGFNPLKKKDVEWFDNILSLGVMNYLDGISIHPYSYANPKRDLRSPEGNLKLIDLYEEHLIKKEGRIIPLYITEIGFPTFHGLGGVDEKIAAKNMLTYNALAKERKYIKGVWWYTFIDSGRYSKNREANFGILDYDGAEKRSAFCLKQISQHVMCD